MDDDAEKNGANIAILETTLLFVSLVSLMSEVEAVTRREKEAMEGRENKLSRRLTSGRFLFQGKRGMA